MILSALILGVTLTIAPARAEVVLGDVVSFNVKADGKWVVLDDRAVSLKIDDGKGKAFVYVRHLADPTKEPGGPITWTPTRAGAYTVEATLGAATAKTKVKVKPAKSGATELFWRMETSKGAMIFRFLPEAAPNHVAHFADLIQRKFYDGLTFDRVLKGFMAQGGHGDEAEYTLPPEFSNDARFRHTHGRLSTARADDPASGSSQFFICFKDAQSLDGKYTVFGELIEGKDALAAIEAIGAQADPEPPKEIVKITKATLVPLKLKGESK